MAARAGGKPLLGFIGGLAKLPATAFPGLRAISDSQ